MEMLKTNCPTVVMISERYSVTQSGGIPEVRAKMTCLACGPEEDDFVDSYEVPASEIILNQSLWEQLRLSETHNKNLETALSKKEDLLASMEADHARELRDKEIENKKAVGILQGQLDEVRGQLYRGQAHKFSDVPELCNPDELSYRQLAHHITEIEWSHRAYPEVLMKAVEMAYNIPPSYQQALVHLDAHISDRDSTKLRGNAALLKSFILRMSGDPTRGLELAEHVVYIANNNHIEYLLVKAQLYRGLCLQDLGLYADALQCFVWGRSICWSSRQVQRLTARAKNKRDSLPNDARGKNTSPGFREVPLSTIAKAVGSFQEGSDEWHLRW